MSNKKKTSLVPKLRFPEFLGTDSWGKKRLFDILNPAIREVAKPNSNYLAVGIRSHGKGTFHKPDQEPEKNSMDRLYLVHRDDLIVNITFAWEGAIAIASDADHGAYVSHRFPTYEFKSSMSTPAFFRYVISNSSFTYKLTLISPGGAGRNRVMSKKDFLEISVAIPSLLEQQKISNCLSSLDELITAQARKVDALKTHKKGLMQQLFPREGETQPRLRFPAFRDAESWKSGNLISLSDAPLSNGVFNDPKKVGSGYKLINVSDMYIDTVIDEDKLSLVELSPSDFAANQVKYGDIFFTRSSLVKSGIAVSNIYFGNSTDVTFDGHLIRFRPDIKKTFPVFSHYLFKTSLVREQLIARGKTATMTTIGQADVASVTLFFPETREQQQIVDCLMPIDNLIIAAAQEFETLKVHKKGLMQHLFPLAEAVQA
jgi:type I restriction enzyme, S subunit